MKRKNALLLLAIIICLIACVFVLVIKTFEINVFKIHEYQLSEFSVKYYGGFDGIRVIKIYDNAIRRGTFEVTVKDEFIDKTNEYPPYLEDLNKDGHDDILIPHSKDSNLAVRYSAFLWNNESKMFEESEKLSDIANISYEGDSLYSNMTIKKVLYPEDKNVPEVYETYRINTEYTVYENDIRCLREYTLIYYSETDIYCYVKNDYNVETGELISSIDDWLNPKQAAEIKFYK